MLVHPNFCTTENKIFIDLRSVYLKKFNKSSCLEAKSDLFNSPKASTIIFDATNKNTEDKETHTKTSNIAHT